MANQFRIGETELAYLDIVNENGRPTGEIVSRDAAHREGLRHRTAHVWVIRKKDQVIIKRYISSAGLRAPLSAHKAMSAKGGMKATNVNEIVKEVFDVTGFADILTIERGGFK